MSAETERDALVDLFGNHSPIFRKTDEYTPVIGCSCMDRVFYREAEDWDSHLAEVLLASAELAEHDRRVKAEAWDEGRGAAMAGQSQVGFVTGDGITYHQVPILAAVNPYRADRIESGDES